MRLAPRPLGNRPPFFALAFSAGPAYKKFFLIYVTKVIDLSDVYRS
jgi:hypothetical protein